MIAGDGPLRVDIARRFADTGMQYLRVYMRLLRQRLEE